MNPAHYSKTNGMTLLATAISLFLSGVTQAEDATMLPGITVESEAAGDSSVYRVDLEQAPVTTPDTAALLRRTPGGNVNRNGPLTGHAQYRGMFADRINVAIDGMHINSGGPNGMDPALSYIPRNLLGSFEVIRGIAPVSSGAETIGGTVIVNSKSIDFGHGDEFSPSLQLSGSGASVSESWSGSVLGGWASRTQKFQLFGSHEKANDTEFPDGKIVPTEYERSNFGAGFGLRTGAHEFGINIRRNETDETGTPALPMDILFINTTIVEGSYDGVIAGYDVTGKLYWTDVGHEMANFVLRTPSNPAKTRLNDAAADGWGYKVSIKHALSSGLLTLGIDGHLDDHNSTVVDPVNNPLFRVENFNGVERNIYGFFAEWNGALAQGWDLQLGGRYNRVDSDAGSVSHFMAGANPAIGRLQNGFNSSDRDKTDNNIDLVVKLSHALSETTSLSIEAGRKTRAPSYQERYLWIPLQATNGLADGNNYVGGIDLDSEKAYEVGFGLDFRNRRFYAEPRVFYRYVDDYIQGTPATDPDVIAVSTANGDPTPLEWSNVKARFYGFDAALGARFGAHWSLDGTLSYVRGERDDINDNLYRIAPLNGRATLTYSRDLWWIAVEGVAYARQDKVSTSNGETETGGYGLIHLRGGTEIAGMMIGGGVENLFDKKYADHLAGINRVGGISGVNVGDRLPGPGRSFFINLKYAFN